MAEPSVQAGADVCAVIPCYNAGARLERVVAGVLLQLSDVLVVDDGSTDGAIGDTQQPGVRVQRLPENRGKGHALIAGFESVLKDGRFGAAIVLDADGQHDPAEIPNLVAAWQTGGGDLVMGVRQFDTGTVPLRSRFGNSLTRWVTGTLLGIRLRDTQCGYRLLSRRFMEHVVREVAGGRYETEMEILIHAAKLPAFKFDTVAIKTLYETGNASSHFHKVRDSFLIYRRLLAASMRARRLLRGKGAG